MTYKFSDKVASLAPSAIREIFKSMSVPGMISLAAGNPAAESFPVAELARLSAEIFKTEATAALQYSITEGYPPLREAVEERIRQKFGIGRDESRGETFCDQTIIVSGGQQGIELAVKVLCNEGDVVICENPTFIGGLNAIRSLGAVPVGVPLLGDGLDTDALEETIKNNPRARMIYLIPTFHNPTGITTSLEKRIKIYEIAKKYGIIIFEDNPYGELRFKGTEVPTIKALDTEGLVIYCSSFSKILSAGMRVGYVTAPAQIVQKMVVAKQSEDVHTNIFFQMLCHKFITECDLEAHIEKIRGIYRHKCGLMLSGLEEHLPESVEFTRPEGGLFVWCTLPEGADMPGFVRHALSKKVAVVPGTTFNCDVNAPSRSFRLNYSTPSDEQIIEGTKRLGETAKEFLK
ncbi:MAG: PLP-dependent aminotransferase family protein [Clostridiales bacterium]|nr:PLP-dependent aminotransferase family protein [Clostridiales bacterium]